MPSLDIERRRMAVRKWDAAHKAEKALYQRERRKLNPTIGREANWRKNGLTFTEGDYVKLYENQNGRCQICLQLVRRLCVDHNHHTKAVRALLCRQCNAGLGSFKDDWIMLERAANYLRSFDAK